MEDFLSLDAETQAKRQFEKLFNFESSEEWHLPASDQVNREKIWEVDTLKQLKNELNITKSLLNDKGLSWQKHTEKINKSELVRDSVKKIVKPEFLTRAWCKFLEIASSFSIVNSDVDVFRSVHLCEAPGAFISALNYHLCSNHQGLKWEWFANSLNPYYEGKSIESTVVDDRLIFHTIKRWHFGEDKTGDILSPTYLQDMVEFLSSKGPIHLVTADGSINCMTDPGNQELTVSSLQFQEIAVALHVLSPGGNLVLKKFTFFECSSVCAMYLLNCCFEKVHVFKPATSKAGNSEVYVICMCFKAADTIKDYTNAFQQFLTTKDVALFSQKDMKPDFLNQLETCCSYFMKLQVGAIKENLMLYDEMTPQCQIHLNEVKEACVAHYIERYTLQPLNTYRRLYSLKKKRIKTSFGDVTSETKFVYTSIFGETYDSIKETESLSWVQYLCNVESRLNSCYPNSRKRHHKRATWFPIWMEIMRSVEKSSYMDWISMGKKVHSIHNSKFCNPALLFLWNEVINSGIKSTPEYHKTSAHTDWDWDPFIDLLEKQNELSKSAVIVSLEVDDGCSNNVLSGLQEAMGKHLETYSCCLSGLESKKYTNTCKTVVFDSTLLNIKTFDAELAMKYNFAKSVASIVNVLEVGDSFVLVFSSLLTRFTVGILFSLLSLFTHATTVLPQDTAPSLTGQIWVLANFQAPSWTGHMLEYFEHISNHEETETNSILEVVPITELCRGQFYEYLLNINQQCMVQRLRKLIKTEKSYTKNDYK